MKRTLTCWSVVTWIATAWYATVSADEGVDKLLDKVAKAYGGTDLLVRTQALKQTGTTYSTMRGASGPVLRAYQHPDRLRIEIHYPGRQPESRILLGPHAWKQRVPVGGPFHGAMVLQAARMGLPYNLLEARKRVHDRGKVTAENGKTLRVVELPLDQGLHVIVEIDPSSGRILKSRGALSTGGGAMEFQTTYEDFRRHEGRLYAAKEGHYAMGQRTGHTQIERVEFSDQWPESLFQP